MTHEPLHDQHVRDWRASARHDAHLAPYNDYVRAWNSAHNISNAPTPITPLRTGVSAPFRPRVKPLTEARALELVRWCEMWTLEQCADISLDRDPREHVADADFSYRLEIVMVAHWAGKLTYTPTPCEFCKWAMDRGLPLPSVIDAAYRAYAAELEGAQGAQEKTQTQPEVPPEILSVAAQIGREGSPTLPPVPKGVIADVFKVEPNEAVNKKWWSDRLGDDRYETLHKDCKISVAKRKPGAKSSGRVSALWCPLKVARWLVEYRSWPIDRAVQAIREGFPGFIADGVVRENVRARDIKDRG